jgi:hypothetical protein
LFSILVAPLLNETRGAATIFDFCVQMVAVAKKSGNSFN